MASFGIFCPKIILDKSQFQVQEVKKNWKYKDTFIMSILKIGIILVPLFFPISYLLEPKVEICLRYFMAKNSQKQPL